MLILHNNEFVASVLSGHSWVKDTESLSKHANQSSVSTNPPSRSKSSTPIVSSIASITRNWRSDDMLYQFKIVMYVLVRIMFWVSTLWFLLSLRTHKHTLTFFAVVFSFMGVLISIATRSVR